MNQEWKNSEGMESPVKAQENGDPVDFNGEESVQETLEGSRARIQGDIDTREKQRDDLLNGQLKIDSSSLTAFNEEIASKKAELRKYEGEIKEFKKKIAGLEKERDGILVFAVNSRTTRDTSKLTVLKEKITTLKKELGNDTNVEEADFETQKNNLFEKIAIANDFELRDGDNNIVGGHSRDEIRDFVNAAMLDSTLINSLPQVPIAGSEDNLRDIVGKLIALQEKELNEA